MPADSNGSGRSTPPTATDRGAERAVLGALLLYGESRYVAKVVGLGLRPEHFYWSQYGMIFRAVVSLAERRAAIDPILVIAELEALGEKPSFGAAQVEELQAEVPAKGNFGEYASRVIDRALWRERSSATREMVAAVQRYDEEAWEKATAIIAPAPPVRPHQARPALRLVVDGESGEVLEREQRCSNCQTIQDQLDGAEREVRSWRSAHAQLKRERDADAPQDPLWPIAAELFRIWKRETKHLRSPWTADRFYDALPLLKKYGHVVFERAICGIAFDPYTKVRKNGSTQRYDGWETLCKTAGQFEEYANRAPKGWVPTLKITSEVAEEKSTEIPRQATLDVVR